MWSAIAGAVGAVAKLLAAALPWWFGKRAGKAEIKYEAAREVIGMVEARDRNEERLRSNRAELERLRKRFQRRKG